MTITEHSDHFEVVSNDGTSKKFWFDQSPSRRAINNKPNKKQALQQAKAYAGKGHVMAGRPDNFKPQSESDHFIQCPICKEWFDCRKLEEVMKHGHKEEE